MIGNDGLIGNEGLTGNEGLIGNDGLIGNEGLTGNEGFIGNEGLIQGLYGAWKAWTVMEFVKRFFQPWKEKFDFFFSCYYYYI